VVNAQGGITLGPEQGELGEVGADFRRFGYDFTLNPQHNKLLKEHSAASWSEFTCHGPKH
jgi:hypothetical protein